jgi:DNA-binding response OmpR family regulator
LPWLGDRRAHPRYLALPRYKTVRLETWGIARVLVVDDDEGARDALAQGLELEGFTVRQAGNGETALRDLRAHVPDIVLLDVGMPGISGVEVVRRLRHDGWTLPVCMLSARDEVDDRVEGLAAGADDYVVKPFAIGELSARLQSLVRLHRARHDRPLEVGELLVDFENHSARRQLASCRRAGGLDMAFRPIRPGFVAARCGADRCGLPAGPGLTINQPRRSTPARR